MFLIDDLEIAFEQSCINPKLHVLLQIFLMVTKDVVFESNIAWVFPLWISVLKLDIKFALGAYLFDYIIQIENND